MSLYRYYVREAVWVTAIDRRHRTALLLISRVQAHSREGRVSSVGCGVCSAKMYFCFQVSAFPQFIGIDYIISEAMSKSRLVWLTKSTECQFWMDDTCAWGVWIQCPYWTVPVSSAVSNGTVPWPFLLFRCVHKPKAERPCLILFWVMK